MAASSVSAAGEDSLLGRHPEPSHAYIFEKFPPIRYSKSARILVPSWKLDPASCRRTDAPPAILGLPCCSRTVRSNSRGLFRLVTSVSGGMVKRRGTGHLEGQGIRTRQVLELDRGLSCEGMRDISTSSQDLLCL